MNTGSFSGQDWRPFVWLVVLGLIPLWAVPAAAQSPGSASDRVFAKVDQAVTDAMRLTGATAATIAVSRRGEALYTRGYGFSDRRQRVQTTPRNSMRLASCTKPFTCTAIRKLIDAGTISEDLLVFDYLGIQPDGAGLADERVRQITVAHLLDHRGGWDRTATSDPMYEIERIRRAMRVSRMQKHHIVRHMWSQPLQADPGAEDYYSNFGYLLLGLVIEKATGQSYIEAVRELVAEPAGIDNLWISSTRQQNRRSHEIFYLADNHLNLHLRDSASGLATTAESLCRFMDAYWMDGQPRTRDRRRYFYQFGSHPQTTTTLMEQRLDGLNYALMLNSRREEHYDADNDAIRDRLNDVLDEVQGRLEE